MECSLLHVLDLYIPKHRADFLRRVRTPTFISSGNETTSSEHSLSFLKLGPPTHRRTRHNMDVLSTSSSDFISSSL